MYVIVTLSVYPHQESLKSMPGHSEIYTVGYPTVARHIFQACPLWIYTQSSNYIHLIHVSTQHHHRNCVFYYASAKILRARLDNVVALQFEIECQ